MSDCPYCKAPFLRHWFARSYAFKCGTIVREEPNRFHQRSPECIHTECDALRSKIADLETKLANREHRIARLEAYALNLESAGARLDVSIGCGCVHSGEGTCAACKDAQREWDAAKGAKP
jgi:hypothetical protein